VSLKNEKKLLSKKFLSNAGKGHNEIFAVVNRMEQSRGVTAAVKSHVPENGGT
jgi:hypothetical protein